MSFTLKPKNSGGGVSVDWEAVNASVEDGTQVARVSLIVDLGEQAGTEAVSEKNSDETPATTVVDTEEEALALIERAGEIISKFKDKKASKTEDGKWSVPFKIYRTKDCQQVAVFVDLVDNLVDYGDGKPKPYRVMLNPSFKGNIRGFDLKAAAPKGKGNKLWTFAPNSVLYALARATRTNEIISEGDNNMNIGLLLGKPLLIEVVKKDGFINVKNPVPLMKGMEAAELPFQPIGVSFGNVSEELLNKALLRKSIIDKIKTALNYDKPEGAKMKAAIEAYEAKFQQNGDTVDAVKAQSQPSSQEGTQSGATSTEEPEPNYEEEAEPDYNSDDDVPF